MTRTRADDVPDEDIAEAAAEARDPQRVLLHMPVDVRSLSLAVVAVLASIFALQWAKAVVIPLLLGIMLSYALAPVVDRLAGWRLPRAAGAGLLLSGIIAALGWGAWSMSDDASAFVETLPEVAQKLRLAMRGSKTRPVDTIAKVQQAAAEISSTTEDADTASLPAASGASPAASSNTGSAVAAAGSAAASGPVAGASGAPAGSSAATTTSVHTTRSAAAPPRTGRSTTTTTTSSSDPSRGITRVVVERPDFNVRDYLWTGTLGLASFLGQTMIVFLVAFFLLASGNNFRRKMVKLAGPKLSQKRVTIQALDEITTQIQRYLMVQLATSVLVGVLTGLAFFLIGLDHAAVWGVVAGITNLIPYVGAVIVGGGSAAIGLLQFGAVDMALLVGGSSFAIHAIVGNLVTPWLTGRASRMSPFAVFVGVLVFGWLWGAVGLILGVPILMVVKTICDRVDELKPVGEFLGA